MSRVDNLNSKVFFLSDVEATRQLGVSLGRLLSAGSTLLLEGNLGAGKTALVQGIGEGLGVEDTVDSPTFTLVNEYLGGRLPLYHLDLYRLSSPEAAGLTPEIFWEGIETEPGIVAIEWAERLPYKPQTYLHIKLTYGVDSGRQATITLVGQSDIEILLGQLIAE